MIKDFNQIAIMAGDKDISYKELINNISAVALHLPIKQTEKCIIFSENREEWIYSIFAIWQKRGIAVPVDATSTISDLAYILSDCKPECIITSPANLATTEAAIKAAGADTKVINLDTFGEICREQVDTSAEDYQPEMSDIALICYTSGTTGSPKGVMLSFSNI
ncbi:MAG: AMP-binding protein, partial [Prevotella sp.]|nr:AMP-binding protein [Prevotella sp.]